MEVGGDLWCEAVIGVNPQAEPPSPTRPSFNEVRQDSHIYASWERIEEKTGGRGWRCVCGGGVVEKQAGCGGGFIFKLSAHRGGFGKTLTAQGTIFFFFFSGSLFPKSVFQTCIYVADWQSEKPVNKQRERLQLWLCRAALFFHGFSPSQCGNDRLCHGY